MTRLHALVILAVASLLVPSAATAQALGIGGRVGTLGVGGEAAIGLGDLLVARGGMGITPSWFQPKATFDNTVVTLTIPSWYNVGVDYYLNGAMRLGAGVLIKREDPSLSAVFNSPQDIGGTQFTPQELGGITGIVDSSDRAPYVLLGFGKHTAPGIGLFLDLGVAFLGDPPARLEPNGGTLAADPNTRDALDREAENYEADMRTYLRFWPILSLGLRIGLG